MVNCRAAGCPDRGNGSIRAGNGPKGISVDEIINQAAAYGISRESALAIIESLIIDDECYQPLKGFVKPL